MKLNVLIGCEESQEVCKAFRELGHNAFSCDLQDCSGGRPEWHIKGDALAEAYTGKYDLGIFHPPCTYLSKAGARWMYPKAGQLDSERLQKAMEAKSLFLSFLNSPIPHVAVENPVPLKIVGLPTETQSIQPYQFGHAFSKKTLLWLIDLPTLQPSDIVSEFRPFLPSNTGIGKRKGHRHSAGIARSQELRSKTFPGIAKAMAQQWSEYIISKQKAA